MDFDGVNSIVCDAEESDWLDVSYSERMYVEEPERKRFNFKFPKFNFKFNFKLNLSRPAKIVAIVALCVVVLAAMLFIDGDFAADVFQNARAAIATSVFERQEVEVVAQSIVIPANVDLVDVADGIATFSGGRVTVSFTEGAVTDVTETSVTVAIDESTSITYDGLTSVYVAVGDTVTVNSLIGKYDGTFTATLSVGGEAVKDVVGSETQLEWYV